MHKKFLYFQFPFCKYVSSTRSKSCLEYEKKLKIRVVTDCIHHSAFKLQFFKWTWRNICNLKKKKFTSNLYLFYATFGLCHWIVFKGCFWTLKILNDFEKLWAAIDLVRSKIKWVVDKAFSDLLCGLVPFMLLCVLRCSFVFLKFVGLHGRSILFLFYAAVEHFINVFNDGTEIFLFSGKRLYRNGLHF